MGDEHSDLSSVRKTVAPPPPSLLPPCSWPQFDDVSVVVHRLWLCEFELQFYAVMDGCLCFSVDFQYWCVSATELPFRFYTAKRIFLHYSRGCSMQSLPFFYLNFVLVVFDVCEINISHVYILLKLKMRFHKFLSDATSV